MGNLDWCRKPDAEQKHPLPYESDYANSSPIVDAAIISPAISILVWSHLPPLSIFPCLWWLSLAIRVWYRWSRILVHGIADSSTTRSRCNHVWVIPCILIAGTLKVLCSCISRCHCKHDSCATCDSTRCLHEAQCLRVKNHWGNLHSKLFISKLCFKTASSSMLRSMCFNHLPYFRD